MSNLWKARRTNFEESPGWGWWQIYTRAADGSGLDRGIMVVLDFNLATQTDELPDLVKEVLDAHNMLGALNDESGKA